MTGPLPPGQGGLNARLDRLERIVSEQGRTRVLPTPMCRVEFGDTNLAWTTAEEAGTFKEPALLWFPTAAFDNAGMYRYNVSGGFTYAELPKDGAYRILLHTHWFADGARLSNYPSFESQILLDSQGVVSVIAGAWEWFDVDSTNNPKTLDVFCEGRAFRKGDKIRFRHSAWWTPASIRGWFNSRSYFAVQYLGRAT